MKVVDMFSAGLPCLAIGGYPSLCELVVNEQNGRVFLTSDQLANQISSVLKGYSDKLEPNTELGKYR